MRLQNCMRKRKVKYNVKNIYHSKNGIYFLFIQIIYCTETFLKI